MSLEAITAGQGLEILIFWSIGAFILGVGAIDTLYKEFCLEKTRRYDD